VFDARKIFEPLDGRSYDLRSFREELGRIRWKHFTELPVDYGVSELMEFARSQKWFTEDEAGTLHFQLAPRRTGATRKGTRASKTRPT
jgi:hypothetical protein